MWKKNNVSNLSVVTILGCFFSGSLEMTHFVMGHAWELENELARNIASTALLFLLTGTALYFLKKDPVLSLIMVYTQYVIGGALIYFCYDNNFIFILEMIVMALLLAISHIGAYITWFRCKAKKRSLLIRLLWPAAIITQLFTAIVMVILSKEIHFPIPTILMSTSMVFFTLIATAETIPALNKYMFLTTGFSHAFVFSDDYGCNYRI